MVFSGKIGFGIVMQLQRISSDPVETIRSTLQRTRLFADWPDETLARLAAGSELRRYKHGEMPCHFGDTCTGVWVVATGRLYSSRTWANGRRMIFDFLPPGQLTGFLAVFDGLPMAFDITADGESTVVHIPRRLFLDIVLPDAALLHQIVLMLCRRSRIDYEHVQLKTINSPRVQLAKIILYHTRGSGDVDGETVVNFSQDVVGSLLGLTRQTVNKELAPMIRDGILARGYGNLIVKDVERLLEIAGSEEPLSKAATFTLKGAPKPLHGASI
jgi:CRP/FNR family cyclic AMP-dependent transcriptional regulator